jgi:hypothetical protein
MGEIVVHKIAAEIYVEQLNKRNGLLRRPVEAIVPRGAGAPPAAARV